MTINKLEGKDAQDVYKTLPKDTIINTKNEL